MRRGLSTGCHRGPPRRESVRRARAGHRTRIQVSGLHKDSDLLTHSGEIHQLDRLDPFVGWAIGDLVQSAAGSEPGGLPGQGDSGEAGGLALLDQCREIDVCGEVLRTGLEERIAVHVLVSVAGQCAVFADPRVEEPLRLEAVVAGDEQTATEQPRKLTVEGTPAGGQVGDLTLFQLGTGKLGQPGIGEIALTPVEAPIAGEAHEELTQSLPPPDEPVNRQRVEELIGEDQAIDRAVPELARVPQALGPFRHWPLDPIPAQDPTPGPRRDLREVDSAAEAGLEVVRGTGRRLVERAQQPRRRAAEERRVRGPGDEVALFADRQLRPRVVATLAIQGLFHEPGEGDRPPFPDPVAHPLRQGCAHRYHAGDSIDRPVAARALSRCYNPPQVAGGVTLPSAERLRELVGGMADRPVLMLADLVADRFISGTPKRISREAPVLILRHEGETFLPGGGANAICNVLALRRAIDGPIAWLILGVLVLSHIVFFGMVLNGDFSGANADSWAMTQLTNFVEQNSLAVVVVWAPTMTLLVVVVAIAIAMDHALSRKMVERDFEITPRESKTMENRGAAPVSWP